MNEHSDDTRHRMGEADLRMALRGLRRDVEPGNDLWPGIAARIGALPQHPQALRPSAASRCAWPLATAALLLLAVGVSWKSQLASPSPAWSGARIATTAGATRRKAPLVQREAETLTVQYQAALREMDAHAVPAGWQPGLEALDRSAAEIRGALQRDPDSRLLLERLRDTYTRRLALSRRALYV
jgi:hypothetical protein